MRFLVKRSFVCCVSMFLFGFGLVFAMDDKAIELNKQLFDVIEDSLSLDEIIKLLKHKDPEIRLSAIEVLNKKGDKGAIRALSAYTGLFLRMSVKETSEIAIHQIRSRQKVGASNCLSVARMNVKL